MSKNLKSIREKLNLTQMEVSKFSKVSIRAYQNYENGTRLPNVEIAQRIASTLGTTIDKLFPINHK